DRVAADTDTQLKVEPVAQRWHPDQVQHLRELFDLAATVVVGALNREHVEIVRAVTELELEALRRRSWERESAFDERAPAIVEGRCGRRIIRPDRIDRVVGDILIRQVRPAAFEANIKTSEVTGICGAGQRKRCYRGDPNRYLCLHSNPPGVME